MLTESVALSKCVPYILDSAVGNRSLLCIKTSLCGHILMSYSSPAELGRIGVQLCFAKPSVADSYIFPWRDLFTL